MVILWVKTLTLVRSVVILIQIVVVSMLLLLPHLLLNTIANILLVTIQDYIVVVKFTNHLLISK